MQDAKKSPSAHHRTTLSGYIFATKACINNRKKNLLSSNISPRCPHNMVNFGLLAAEIDPVVWGTPANFNNFRVLAVLLHGSHIVSVSQTYGVEQRAPPMFGRAAIGLGIGPPSSCLCCCVTLFVVQCRHVAAHQQWTPGGVDSERH